MKADLPVCYKGECPVDEVLQDIAVIKNVFDILRDNIIKASLDIKKENRDLYTGMLIPLNLRGDCYNYIYT